METVAEGAPGAASGEGGASGDPAGATGEVAVDDGAGSPESDGGGRAETSGGDSIGPEALGRPPEDPGDPVDRESDSESEAVQAGYGSGEDGFGDDSFAGVPGSPGTQAEQDQQDLGTSSAASSPDASAAPEANEAGELNGWGEGGSSEGGASGDTAAAMAEGGADDGPGSPESAGGGPAETPDGSSGGRGTLERSPEDPRDQMVHESASDVDDVQQADSGSGPDRGAGESLPGESANAGSAGSEGQRVAAERDAQRRAGDQTFPQRSSESGEARGSAAEAESGQASQGSGSGETAGSTEQGSRQTSAGEHSSSDDVDPQTAGTDEEFGRGRPADDGDTLRRDSRGRSGAQRHSGGPLENREEATDTDQASAVDARTDGGRADDAFGGGAEWPNNDDGIGSDVGRGGSGEREFERSLERSDDIILSEREAVATTGRSGPAADDTFGQSVGGSATDPGRDGMAGGERGRDGAAIETDQDDGLEAARFEGCHDEDRVARQLCEAASKEEDPFLRAALWEEYNEYRRVLAR